MHCLEAALVNVRLARTIHLQPLASGLGAVGAPAAWHPSLAERLPCPTGAGLVMTEQPLLNPHLVNRTEIRLVGTLHLVAHLLLVKSKEVA